MTRPRIHLVPLALAVAVAAPAALAKEQYLLLDNHRTRVNWSDGDSFSVVDGPDKGMKTRVMTYNTLESYGPVHYWGGFTAWELYHLSKEATKLAKEKLWTCFKSGSADGYGRQLVFCPDLAKEMLRAGLAHVFHVGDGGPNPEFVAVQAEAQQAKRGIWEKGVPDVIVTSMHSLDEGGSDPNYEAYNRVCDTKTGKSDKVPHRQAFQVCDAWCSGGACMIYVPFNLRYGKERPECLHSGRPARTMGLEPTAAPAPGDAPAPPPEDAFVRLDGVRTKVLWDDGDTFEVVDGAKKGVKARLHGFNTPESYGAVHFWGGFTAEEIYGVAKSGTRAARSKEWVCTLSDKDGGYGRKLVDCPDLAKALVVEGLAHVFAVREEADAGLLELQKKAQSERRGMWLKGIPQTIVTSVHSVGEWKDQPDAYHRVVDTLTGVSWAIKHRTSYQPCDAWCHGGSCMLYIPYDMRYGDQVAMCLKDGNRSFMTPPSHLRAPVVVEAE